MTIQKTHRKHLKAVILVLALAVASPSFAWMGNGWYNQTGRSQSTATASTLTAGQQEKIDAVKSKYQSRLNDLRQKLDAKSSELTTARTNDNTTVGLLKPLERDLFQLERQYWSLLDQANAEASGISGNMLSPYFTCSYTGCNHRGHASPVATNGRYQNCCW